MKTQRQSYGYYYVSVAMPDGKKLLKTNSERAFVISQLQDLLTPRLLIDSVPEFKQLASYVDLLAFSINPFDVKFVLFTIDASIATHLAEHIAARLAQYQDEYQPYRYKKAQNSFIQMKKLRGSHHALEKTVELHLAHTDWEYDRYSSIGFYLHDRRGEWMRTWRLTQLYENDSSNYRLLLAGQSAKTTPLYQPRLQTRAS